MKKIIIYTLSVLLVIVFGIVIISCSLNPMRKSEEQIRENLLELTPIGSSMEDVIKVIENNEQWYKNYRHYEWFGKYEHFNRGYLMRDGILEMYYEGFKNINEAEIVGKETIKATIGQYTGFFNITVFAYWAFDENSELVDVVVIKESDSF